MSRGARRAAGTIRIGTSGWSYPHWRRRFYPEGTRAKDELAFYARTFGTVEINNSFYRLPTPAAIETWRRNAPEGFVFAVKASRWITHMKKLREPEEGLARLLPVVEGLGEALGPVLFQLPPRWGVDEERLARFLEALPAGHRYAVELRDESWFTPGVERRLRDRDVARCVYEIDGRRSPLEPTAGFAYVRLHGPGEKYKGRYQAGEIEAWGERVREWAGEGLDVYVYFDNDERAYAVENAVEMGEVVRKLRREAKGVVE